jgi:hypothetical protein
MYMQAGMYVSSLYHETDKDISTFQFRIRNKIKAIRSLPFISKFWPKILLENYTVITLNYNFSHIKPGELFYLTICMYHGCSEHKRGPMSGQNGIAQ